MFLDSCYVLELETFFYESASGSRHTLRPGAGVRDFASICRTSSIGLKLVEAKRIISLQMGRIADEKEIAFVVSSGDNFYERGLTNDSDPKFEQSFTNIYSASGLQKQWYAGKRGSEIDINNFNNRQRPLGEGSWERVLSVAGPSLLVSGLTLLIQ